MLRHIFGVIVGLVLAPVLPYVLARAALVASGTVAQSITPTSQTMLAIGVLAVVGVVVGALTSARWLSPIAAVIVGVPMLALTAIFLASPGNVVMQAVPLAVFSLVAQGILVVLGAVLVVSALFPQRWRGRDKDIAPDPSYLQPPPMPPAGGQEWSSTYAPPGGFTEPSGSPRPPEMPGEGTSRR